MCQPEFVEALIRELKKNHIHMAIETTGYVDSDTFRRLAPMFDLLLYDVKHYDSDKHFEGTKVHNEQIIENLKWAYDGNGKPMVIFLANMLRDKTGIPVAVTNDANAAAVGEMTYGVAKGMKDFIMITLGTGVGSGIVIDGKVVYGHDGFAGELGHTVIVRDGRQCNCGHKGCLETYTSAVGVARTAREFLTKRDEPSLLRSLDPEKITSKDIYDAARKGDRLALEIFEFTGKIMGEAFADFVAFSAPEAIILFGGLARSKEFLTEPILKSMNENLLQMWKGKVRLLYSTLKDSDAAILGASALAWEL